MDGLTLDKLLAFWDHIERARRTADADEAEAQPLEEGPDDAEEDDDT